MNKYIRIMPVLLVILLIGCASTPGTGPSASINGDLPWEISPWVASWQEMSAASNNLVMEEEHGVRVLLSEGYFTFAEDGSLTESYKWVYEVLDQSGIDGWSSTKVNWTPWNQERPTIRVRVTNPDGNSYFLSEDHIIESTESSEMANIYSDRKLLQAPFPKVTIGSIVEEETTIVSKVPKFDTGISRSWFFEGSNPLAMNRVVVEVPDNLSFHYKVSLKDDLIPQISNHANSKTYLFEYPFVPVAEENEYGLPLDHPHWVSLGFSTGDSWQKIAGVYSDLVEDKIELTDSSEILNKLIADSSYATAVNITEWLNTQIRYTGLELGTGSIIPSTPEVTLERGFGDCKDKAVIVTAMLREAGFEAWVTLLRSGTSRDINPLLPSLGGFNHAIVYVGGDKPFFIDPTSEYSFNGYLPIGDQNRWALVASSSTVDLIKTHQTSADDNKTVREIEYFLSDDGFADVEEHTTYYGGEDSSHRGRYAFSKEEDIDTALDEYINRTYRFGENTGFDYSDPTDFSKNFHVSLSIKGAGRGVTEESQAVVAIMQGELVNYLPDLFSRENSEDEDEETRVNDFYFYKPITFETRYIINPPVGFSLRELPQSETLELGNAKIVKSFSKTEEKVEAVLTLISGYGSISSADFESTREKVITFSKSNPILLVFDHIGEKLLTEGDYRGSIDYLKNISKLEPDNEIHLIRLADALLKAGLGLDARKAAENAVVLNGKSAKAYSKLAWVLQHDELGRRLRHGYERSDAVAAYRKAVELDPDEWSNYANLAILLEYDENGLRYSSEDLREAVETYKGIGDDLSEHGMDINLITDLLYLQDWEELDTALEKINNQKTVSLYKLLAYGAANNFDAAFSEASKSGDALDRRKLLSNAGELLIHIRHYSSAARFLEEASKGSTDAVSLESRAETLYRTILHEEIEFDLSKPEDLIRKFYKELYLSDGSDFSELKNVVSSDLYKLAIDKDQNNNFFTEWRAILNRSISSGLKLDVILDLIFSDLKFQNKGDSDEGYHLKLVQTGLGTNLDSNFYIKKINGSLKIVGTDSFREPIGNIILDDIESGNTEFAIIWLNWFLKDYGSFTRQGDEPLYGHPILGFWKKRGNDKLNLELMKIAAASILVTGKSSYPKASIILEDALINYKSLKNEIYYGLYFGYQTVDNFEGQYRAASWLYNNYPESVFAWSSLLSSLLNLNRYDELKKLADERLIEDDEDAVAIDMLINMYFTQMDFESVNRIFQDLKVKNRLTARLYNAVAWMDLFDPDLDESALEKARQAVTLSNSNNPPILHTLSALYAEFGRCEEARNTLDRVMQLSGASEPSSDDWYVLGRIAEEYGMNDSAEIYYANVEKPESLARQYDSSYTLAERRLKVIRLLGY
jgi:tetratricopeptide (TPR) repeat protein/transglutaminase-like putative cysteine protease